MDIGGFTLRDGHNIIIARAWSRGTEQEKAFLREVHASACAVFTTVLGPGADGYHTDHLHLDLALHAMTSSGPRRICKPLPSPQLLPAPKPKDDLPDPPELEEELDIAQAPAAASGTAHAYSPLAIASVLARVPPEPPHRPAPLNTTMSAAGDPLRELKTVAPAPSIVYQPQRPMSAQAALPRSAALQPPQQPSQQLIRPTTGSTGLAVLAHKSPPISSPKPSPISSPKPQKLEAFDLDDVTSAVPRH
jgi:hypothetical protein